MARVRNVVIGSPVDEVKKERARQLRHAMTPQQALLWAQVRGRQLRGLKFRREQPVAGFIVDFYCHDAALVVEVDGAVHDEQAAYDAERDEVLAVRGLLVIRFSNDDVEQRMTSVLERIVRVCLERMAGGTSPPGPLS